MGGLASACTAETTDILFEAAFFPPAAIAGRARRYGLITDAGQRFERGVDPAHQERAVERATQLLLEIAGGKAGPVHVVQDSERLPQAPGSRICAAIASASLLGTHHCRQRRQADARSRWECACWPTRTAGW